MSEKLVKFDEHAVIEITDSKLCEAVAGGTGASGMHSKSTTPSINGVCDSNFPTPGGGNAVCGNVGCGFEPVPGLYEVNVFCDSNV